jgi:hypothetical protein
MGADKNSSRRRWLLQQDKHDNQNTSPTQLPMLAKTTQQLECYWSLEPTTTKTLTPNTQRKTAHPTVCAILVRLMAPVIPVDSVGQAGDKHQVHSEVPGSLSDFSMPWKKPPPKLRLQEKTTLHKT